MENVDLEVPLSLKIVLGLASFFFLLPAAGNGHRNFIFLNI